MNGTLLTREDLLQKLVVLAELERTICGRRDNPAAGSYTNKLFDAGLSRIGQKVGEEGVEVAVATATRCPELVVAEAADLFYHVSVALVASGKSFGDVMDELRRRAGRKRKPAVPAPKPS